MKNVLPYVIFAAAAALEVFGDLGIRLWAEDAKWPTVHRGTAVWGGGALVAYGLVLNLLSSPAFMRWIGQEPLDFGRLLGFYITVFFVVSQIVSMCRPGQPWPTGPWQLVGCVMIAFGGLAFQYGAR